MCADLDPRAVEIEGGPDRHTEAVEHGIVAPGIVS